MEEGNWGGEVRKQTDARQYAEAVKEVGRDEGIPVVDVWEVFMAKAGWKKGDNLVGTRESGENEILKGLLYDGTLNICFDLDLASSNSRY